MCGNYISNTGCGRKYPHYDAKYPEMIVGAGTVLNVEQVERAMNAGARFIVCPGFDSKVVDYCLERKFQFYLDALHHLK